MKKILVAALYICLVFATALVVTEIFFRIEHRLYYAANPGQAYANDYSRSINVHLHTLWTGEAPEGNPFLPPLSVYTNREENTSERLQQIYEATRLPPSRTWDVYDFVRLDPDKEKTAYTVTTNALGFRSKKEYTAEKPPNTYRIIVLGSYQSFGLGVSDEDAYPAQLEERLNARNDGITYEVWNAGRPAATAVVGLAHMEHLLEQYDPDLFILDYGFIDNKIFGDNFFPLVALLPGTHADSLVRRYAGPVVALLDRTLLWDKYTRYAYLENPELSRIFLKTMGEITDKAEARGVPVVLVKQIVANTLNDRGYQELTNENVFYFSVDQWFTAHPPAYPPAEEWKTGYWDKTYLSELDPQKVSTSTWPFIHLPYRLDVFQINTFGMEQIAEGLAQTIEKNVLPKTR